MANTLFVVCTFPTKYRLIHKSKMFKIILMIEKKIFFYFIAATENGLLFSSYTQGPWGGWDHKRGLLTNRLFEFVSCTNEYTLQLQKHNETSCAGTLFRYQPHPQVMSPFIRTKGCHRSASKKKGKPTFG